MITTDGAMRLSSKWPLLIRIFYLIFAKLISIAKGVSKSGVPKCKIVTVVMGDLESCTQDIILVNIATIDIDF